MKTSRGNAPRSESTRRRRTLVAGVMLAMSMPWLAHAADPPRLVELFPLAKGERWAYMASGTLLPASEVTATVTSVDGQTYTVEERFDGRVVAQRQYSSAGGWVVMARELSFGAPKSEPLTQVFDPPRPVVKVEDPAPGDRWVWYRPGIPSVKETSAIVDIGPTRVFLGTYLATHVHTDSPGADGVLEATDEWYAEHVGLIKRVVTRANLPVASMELKDYSP